MAPSGRSTEQLATAAPATNWLTPDGEYLLPDLRECFETGAATPQSRTVRLRRLQQRPSPLQLGPEALGRILIPLNGGAIIRF